jgi:methyl-accepting chemotaxis protein
MNFSQRMILSMLAVLLLFALVNGLLAYSIIKNSDEESINEFNLMMRKDERESITLWHSFAYTNYHPYVVKSRKHSDSTEIYKYIALSLLEKNKFHDGFYFVFNSDNGNIIKFKDSLGYIKIPPDSNAFNITDAKGKKFIKTLRKKIIEKDSSVISFDYLKKTGEVSMGGLAEGAYIEDWRWIVMAGNYSERLDKASKTFSERFMASRNRLVGNLFGIMLISFLIGLFMIFKQTSSFVTPLHDLSDYLHNLAKEGLRFENFNIDSNSQEELKALAEDLNSLVHNIGSLIENVHVSADKVSDLSGSCTDMLDIVDYDAKLVGQRTVEMLAHSEEVVDNVNGMAVGIEEIYINLDDLKKLTSQVAEKSTDVRTSISQMSEAMKELSEKSHYMQNNVISVTQAVNDIGIANSEDINQINVINNFSENILQNLDDLAMQVGELRKHITLKNMERTNDIADELYNKIASIQLQLTNMKNEQLAPYSQLLEGRKKLSKEIYSDTLDLNNFIGNVVSYIADINSNTQYINSNTRYMTNDINEAYRNLEEVVNSTNSMNAHAKQAITKMDEFYLKLKRVEEAHSAIEHTLVDAKGSMKSLNDLSASLRKVVDDLVRLDKSQKIKGIKF